MRFVRIKTTHWLRKIGLLSVIILVGISNFSITGQDYELRINKVTDEKGMDPGATFAIAEDSTGFIWFGTVDGLYRYDGFNYKIYRNEKNNPNSLAWNTIRALCISKDNKIWIGTQGGGLDCFDIKTGIFAHYPFFENRNDGISGSDIWSLMCDTKGNIWIGVLGKGIDMLDLKTNTFVHYKILPDGFEIKENITIKSIFEDSEGKIWIGMMGFGLSMIDPKTREIKNFRHDPKNPNSIGSNDVFGISEGHDKNLVICTYTGGLNFFNKKRQTFERVTLDYTRKNNPVSELTIRAIEREPGVFWVGTEFGLYKFDKNKNRINHYQHINETQNSLTDNRIRDVFKDSRGIIWLANESGVDKIVEQQYFKIYKNDPSLPGSFPSGKIRSIFEDRDGYIWFGIIDNGIVRFNPANGSIKRYTHIPGNPHSISGYHITSIFQDSNGTLWFGEWDTGLNKFNSEDQTFELVAGNHKAKTRFVDTRIQFIREDKPGVLWIGTESGIIRYHIASGKHTMIQHDIKSKNSLSANAVQSNAFARDSEGNLWIGTWSGGLNKISFPASSPDKPVFKHFKSKHGQTGTINNNNIISLLLDGDLLWIGTFGGGLNCLDIKKETFRYFTTENGLSNNIIFGILQDKNKNLWLSTDRGISMFNPQTESFTNYSKSDGLQDDHFYWGASCQTRNGELYFGGIKGANSFNPDNHVKKFNPPVPVILDVKIFEKSMFSNNPIKYPQKFILDYDQNYITFEYTGLDYFEPDKNLYQIKLDGLNKDWHTVGNRRFSSFSGLAPGTYVFRLKAANKFGDWSDSEIACEIVIKPPWWNTIFARISYAILILSAFFTVYFLRTNILEKQKKKLEDLVEKRTKVIYDQKIELQEVNRDLYDQKEELSLTLDELRNAQKKLIEVEKMASLGTLTAGVAHEINNPLNYIMGAQNTLENYFNEHGSADKNTTDFIQNTILVGVDRISGIVKGLNQFSRSNEKLDEDCYLHQIIDNCLVMLHNKLKHKAQVQKNYFDGQILIKGNVGKLHQVFVNILDNAIQAIETEGIIKIQTALTANSVQITIEDNGMGIAKHNLSKLTDPFFTTKDPGKGTGLGLSISYSIIKDHKGSLEFESELNKGTKVILTLPVKA
jgi:signal transduction histidine kinase/ligand-binding sensor domain-containing protein